MARPPMPLKWRQWFSDMDALSLEILTSAAGRADMTLRQFLIYMESPEYKAKVAQYEDEPLTPEALCLATTIYDFRRRLNIRG